MTYVRLDPDWYRIKFNLAGARADWGLKGGDRSVQFPKAHADAAELSRAALEVILEKPKGVEESLNRLLDEILPAAIALWAATLDPRKPPPERSRLIRLREKICSAVISLWTATLNAWNRTPAPKKSPAKKVRLLTGRRVLERLKARTLSPEEALHYALSRPNVSAIVRYNIACSQTLLGDYAEAAETLRAALKQTSARVQTQLAGQALDDPSLEALLKSPEGAPLKDELPKWAHPPDEDPLAAKTTTTKDATKK